jgi:hypothetical protein
MASNFTTAAFLDDLKQGWGVKYGPILQECGLDDLDDAKDLSEVELDGLLGRALRAKGTPPLHVFRIVKRLYLANSSNQGTLFVPFFLISNNHTQQARHSYTGNLAKAAHTTFAITNNDRANVAVRSSMASGSEPRTMPFLQRKGVLSNSPTRNEDTCESDGNDEDARESLSPEGQNLIPFLLTSGANPYCPTTTITVLDDHESDGNDEDARDSLSPEGQNLIPFLLTSGANPSCPTTTITVLDDHDDDVVCFNEAPCVNNQYF